MKVATAKAAAHVKAASHAKLLTAAGIWAMLRRWGGVGLLVLGVIDSSLVPTFGSLDIFNAVLSARHRDLWWYYALMSTAGSVIGAYVMYRVAKKAGMGWMQKKLGPHRVERVNRLLESWGVTAVVISVVAPPPFPSSAFFVAAGALEFPYRKFLAAVVAGRAFRYFLVAWITSHYSRRIIRLFRHPEHYAQLTIGITVLVALFVIAVVLTWRYLGQGAEQERQRPEEQPQVRSG